MRPTKGFIVVEYDYGHMRYHDLGGIEIEISREINNDLKEGNDQRAKVIYVHDENGWLKPGDIVWTHYLASDKMYELNVDERKLHRIKEGHIFFRINEDGSLDMSDDVYLGTQIITEAPKTESGIYLTPFAEKKEPLRVNITNVPKNRDEISVGENIITQDDYQYVINYQGQSLVKVDYNHIIAAYA